MFGLVKKIDELLHQQKQLLEHLQTMESYLRPTNAQELPKIYKSKLKPKVIRRSEEKEGDMDDRFRNEEQAE